MCCEGSASDQLWSSLIFSYLPYVIYGEYINKSDDSASYVLALTAFACDVAYLVQHMPIGSLLETLCVLLWAYKLRDACT